MTVLVDTSAFFALLDEEDSNHSAARGWLASHLVDVGESLVTHSYVVVESAALVHRRLGAPAVRALLGHYVPGVRVVQVEPVLHDRAVATYLAGLNRRVSLVDRVSFEFARAFNITQAFAFDRDFTREGIELVP